LDTFVIATDQPKPSLGHEPLAYDVQVLVSPAAAAAYRSWDTGSRFEAGTWLVARHSWREDERANGRQSPPYYVMHRDQQGWVFAVADTNGLEIPSNQGVCLDCHTAARSDSVFGPSRRQGPEPLRAPPRNARTEVDTNTIAEGY
jgi:hypothetical protein